MLKEFHNEKEISQDDLRRGEEIIQNLTDNYVSKIDLLLEKKERSFRNLKMKNLNHLAVIMDGNSRWASSRNLPSKAGHKEGVKKARLAVEYALEKKLIILLFLLSVQKIG